jgi:hypothetical protein
VKARPFHKESFMPPFNKDTAFEMAQKAALARKVKAANESQKTFKQDVKETRQNIEATKRQNVDRYYISTPLAQAEESVRGTAVKLEIQIPGGPTAHKDEDDNVIYREMGSLILLEGEGVTTDVLWAEYIMREYPEWEVSRVKPSGLSSYMQEIQEVKQDLQMQKV